MEQMRRMPMRRPRLSSFKEPGAAESTCRFITMLTLQGNDGARYVWDRISRKALDLDTV
jgi:hypothetical protein